MSKKQQRRRITPEHPTDKRARSNEAPQPDGKEAPIRMSGPNGEDIVDEASKGSFPASDPPAYARGTSKHTTDRQD